MENLFELMQELVEKNVKAYKTDFEIDKDIMLDKENGDEFYWYLRKCGTDIYEAEKVKFEGSEENTSAKYYLGQEGLKIFHIKIEKRENKYVYGTIEPVKNKSFENLIITDAKKINTKKVRIVLNDGIVVEECHSPDRESRDIINTVLYNLKKDMKDLLSFRVVKYFS